MQRRGYTLIEMALVLALLALLLLAATPAFRRARAVIAVRAAQAELLGLIAQARAGAPRSGGTQLVIDPPGTVSVAAADGTPLHDPVDFTARYGVTLRTPGGARVVLRYDALGIGRMTAATITLQHGSVSGAVVVSAYGRART